MDAPVVAEVETKSEKTDETEGAKSYECGLCDTEVVYKIAQELLPGLASSCVDNTTGGIFTSAGSVAVDMRKEMADYLTQRSETYVAEFLLSENSSGLEISEHPFDIIINLIDDFSASKRNMFSRVSEWVLSDRREDRIDDFVQEMDINGFWLLARREYVASVLLKNVDYKNAFHCNMVCSSEDEIINHRLECKFRPMDCTNEGCTTRYCAAQKEHHEAVCPFMILPCEQKCSDYVMRREMDRHCVTICPMKLVNCSFYTVGCKSSIPRCNVQQHNADDLSSHLLYIIRTAHKEASDDDLKNRVEQIRSLSNIDKLARARDARALTYLIKDAEAKLGPLEVKTKPHTEAHEDSNKKESPTKTEHVVKDGSNSPIKREEQPASETRPSTEKPAIKEEDTKLTTEENADSPVKIEESKDKEESFSSPSKEDGEHRESPIKKEVSSDSQEKRSKGLAAKEEEQRGSPIKGTLEEQSQREDKETTRSPRGIKVDEPVKSPKKETIREASGHEEEEFKKSPKDEKRKQLSSSNEEDAKKSPKKETLKQSSKGGKEELKQSPKTSRRDEESKNSPKKETSRHDEELSNQTEKEHDSYYSDEESMKSPS